MRLAQGASRQEMLIAKRLLAVNQNDVLAPAGQAPVLEPVVQQKGVAPEILDGVASAFHPVLVHQHDNVLEVGSEHVRLVSGRVGIQQERYAIRDDARSGVVVGTETGLLLRSHCPKRCGLERYPRDKIATVRP